MVFKIRKFKHYFRIIRLMIFTVFIIIFELCFINLQAQEDSKNQNKLGNQEKAKVTFLKGLVIKDNKNISCGDFLFSGDKISVKKSSKLEIKFSDGSITRFNEESEFELKQADFDEKTKSKKICINVILGKSWAKISKFFTEKVNNSKFEIVTANAVTGVRGSRTEAIYQIDVSEDNSAEIKTYLGEVAISPSKRANQSDQSSQDNQDNQYNQDNQTDKVKVNIFAPKKVEGPKIVSLQEWKRLVKAMQKVVIKPNGEVSEPISFAENSENTDSKSLDNTDNNDNNWIKWNKDRDNKDK